MAYKLTPARFNMLRLCATADERGRMGIPLAYQWRFKPEAQRTAQWLHKKGLIIYVLMDA